MKDWGKNEGSEVLLNGKPINAEQGIVRDLDGSYKLVVWIELMSEESVEVIVKK